MPTFNFIISVADEPEIHRKDEGDIIAINPAEAEVGRKTIEDHLFVPIEINGMTLQEVRARFLIPLYADGSIEGIDWRDFNYKYDDVDSELYPHKTHCMSLIFPGQIIEKPKRLHKFRYQIPLSLLGDIDMVKCQNKNRIYQPFLKESKIVAQYTNNDADYEAKYDSINKIYKIKKKAKAKDTIIPFETEFTVHIITPTIDKEDEKIFSFKKGVDLIRDKYDGSYIYPKE